MRPIALVVIGMLVSLQACSDSTPIAPRVDDTTSCVWAVKVFDANDRSAVVATFDYIERTMRKREQETGSHMFSQQTAEGRKQTVVLAWGWCDKHREGTVHDAALKIFDTFDEAQKTMGIGGDR